MVDTTEKHARIVEKLLEGTRSKRVKWTVEPRTPFDADEDPDVLGAEFGKYSVTLVNHERSARDFTIWLEIVLRSEQRRRERFSDDDLSESGFGTAATWMIQLYSLADRQAYGKDELVDGLLSELADIETSDEDPRTPKRDDDIPF